MPARLALVGDIHANHAALAAVLRAVDAAGIADGVCTGDLVMRGVAPAECIEEIRRRGWPCTMGNTDQKVATRPRRSPDDPKTRRAGSRSWTSARLSDGDIAYLASLPMVARVEMAGGVRVAVMHGSPTDPREAVTADTTEDELLALGRRIDADVIVMGHVHEQMARRAGPHLYVNPGSVGEALDGDLFPRWAWLEVGPDGIAVHLERLDEPLATIRQR